MRQRIGEMAARQPEIIKKKNRENASNSGVGQKTLDQGLANVVHDVARMVRQGVPYFLISLMNESASLMGF